MDGTKTFIDVLMSKNRFKNGSTGNVFIRNLVPVENRNKGKNEVVKHL